MASKTSKPHRQTKAERTNYDNEVLAVIAYEYSSMDRRQEAERKIKRRLRDKKLGVYDPERFAAIRRFKDELQDEVCRCEKSDYYTGRHGADANLADFDLVRLTRDFARRHPTVSKDSIARFVPFTVFNCYLR